MPKTKDAVKILEGVTGNNEAIKAGVAAARVNFEAAQMIYNARTKAGLSQSAVHLPPSSAQSSRLSPGSKMPPTKAIP
jgi:hypothetical protein